jgi:farnesyl-diphosphate farnesyltransferase
VPSSDAQQFLLTSLLRDVSRSFYLTLKLLPAPIRPQISLAYLLARATDTVADTRLMPRQKRLELLRTLRTKFSTPQLQGLQLAAPEWNAMLNLQKPSAETMLIARLGQCLDLLATFDAADQRLIAELLQTIISGQIFDLETFPDETQTRLAALRTPADLDRYTYLVAGCVGEFWTRMCVAHLQLPDSWRDGSMEPDAVRFGKGLQLVNILRDLPRDLRLGRCYFPETELAKRGLAPEDLLRLENLPRFRPCYDAYIALALDHLNAACRYTLAIPPSYKNLRIACALPILIGIKTLSRLRASHQILNPAAPVKIPRYSVHRLLARLFFCAANDKSLAWIFRHA